MDMPRFLARLSPVKKIFLLFLYEISQQKGPTILAV